MKGRKDKEKEGKGREGRTRRKKGKERKEGQGEGRETVSYSPSTSMARILLHPFQKTVTKGRLTYPSIGASTTL